MMERLSTGEKQNLSFYKVETYPGFSTTQNGGISVASQFRQSQMDEEDSEENWTVQRLLSKHCKTLEAVSTVVTALQQALVFGV